MTNLNQLQANAVSIVNFLNDEQTTANQDNSHLSLQQAMAMMQQMLGELEIQYSKLQESMEGDQTTMGSSYTDIMKTLGKSQVKQVEKQVQEQADQSVWSKILEAFEIIAAAVVAVVSFASGNIALGISVIVLTALTVSGAMSDLTQAISKGITQSLENDGVDASTAESVGNVLGSILVTAMTVVATLGVGAAAGLASGLSDSVEEGVADSVKSALKETLGTALSNGLQSATGTNLIVNIMEAAASGSNDKKTQEILQIIGDVIQLVVGLLGALAGGSSEDAESTLGQISNKLKTLTQAATKLTDSGLKTFVAGVQTFASLAQAIPSIGSGTVSIMMGEALKAITELKGAMTQIEATIKENSQGLKHTQTVGQETLEMYQELTKNIVKYIEPMEAAARDLSL